MGRKGNWFSAVRKALGTEPKEKKDQSSRKSKKKWFRKNKAPDPVIPSGETAVAIQGQGTVQGAKLAEAKNEQSKHAYTVAIATAAAAEAAAAVAAHAAAEVVRLTAAPRYMGKSKEEIAAIKIQTAFRGYLARRALRALRGLVRLKTLVEGPSVKRQAATALRCMQTISRVQSQIHARRIRMSEENQALQRQLLRKSEKELEKLKMGEEWDDSTQSKERIEANLISKQEASIKRERALAYAYTHQQSWRNPSKSLNPTFMDPSNPHWGWSWLERWMAARPWESRQYNGRSYSFRELNLDNRPSPSTAMKSARPPSHHQSPSTPPSKAPSLSSITGKGKPSSSKGSIWDYDSRSMLSAQSERYIRRHSIAGGSGGPSSVRDDDSLSSLASVPSYMAPTQSAKAKSRLPSPLGINGTPPEKGSAGSAKKRLSFTGSPAAVGMRRHSGPPRIDSSSIKEVRVHMEEKPVNEEQR
ncbi:protein IQ-DOMAIN 1 [Punica granatum]|uniref:Protein IQ-DOMAIN 1 n=2 Tax=Punica granatum TaxID=22663 RepID=A0A6P8CQT1_PUNGR|nr:protein IQ-DOMAIN 1 [Punica granatum]XP_031382348.1 protein IQ-DOMAIN 1 [Punica granatum]XP_031382349.1 protein IQ-DOMAIN 1 [Punica granatum]XP_031382350.1 protein IQ-DOMAIN 1 [Punica granatum]XP_031382351.1 protein IQ-DOMAIN 1 [Punica granatum]PKI43267.1 hypothetical protein CRG98_036353 [Punica granatum]